VFHPAWSFLLLVLTAMALRAAPIPDGLGPLISRVFQLPDAPRLTWVGGGTNLLTNGGFETGDFTGWERESPAGKLIRIVSIPTGGTSSANVFSGQHSVGFVTSWPGPQTLSQVVSLPAGSSGAVLSWVDRVRNEGPTFVPPDQGFRVEAQTVEGFTLAVLFELRAGDPPRPPWSRRSVDVSAFAGRTVRFAFVASDNVALLELSLDDIRLEVAPPADTTYEVFLASGAAPTSADRLGSTAVPSLALPDLLPDTAYFWQVRASDPSGTTNGPV